MIHAIIGSLIEITPSYAVILTPGGIEFTLLISNSTASRLSALQGADRREVRILTHLQHREDAMILFGFFDERERTIFLELLKVNGIGAKQALKILSGVQVDAFIRALDDSDVAFIASIPGIGPKTSQKILLALRDTIIVDRQQNTQNRDAGGLEEAYRDLASALSDMGYDRRQVVQTLQDLISEHQETLGTMNMHEKEQFLFKQALIQLG